MMLKTVLWQDVGTLILLGIGYALVTKALLLPLIIIFLSLVLLFIASNYQPPTSYAKIIVGVYVVVYGSIVLTSSNNLWLYWASLGGLFLWRGAMLEYPHAKLILGIIFTAILGIGYAQHHQFELVYLVFPIISLLLATLWSFNVLSVVEPSQTLGTSTIVSTSTASQPSLEMPSIAPFAFSQDDTDRLGEVIQQLETINTIIEQQVHQSARQMHVVEQLNVIMRDSREQLQSMRQLLQTIDGTVVDVMSTTSVGQSVVQVTQHQLQQAFDTVQGVGHSMAHLVSDLRRVSEIVLAVSDIATQSNFLALNAQIEAARAGELGRGFTIVAEEVRELANQSRESTKMMKGILRSIHQTSSQAVQITETSSTEIANYSTNAEKLNELISTIEEMVNNTHRVLARVVKVVENLQNQFEQISAYNQQLNQQTMQSQASLLMADNLSQTIQAILKKS